MPAKTGKQQGNRGRFKPGESGNPKGRPQGSRHKATLAAQALLDGEAEALTRKVIEKALEGDGMALRLVINRILPPRKEHPVTLKLPPVKEAANLPQALQAVIEAVVEGEITPREGQALTAIFDSWRKGLEFTDLEARLKVLEEKINHGS